MVFLLCGSFHAHSNEHFFKSLVILGTGKWIFFCVGPFMNLKEHIGENPSLQCDKKFGTSFLKKKQVAKVLATLFAIIWLLAFSWEKIC